MTTQSTLARRAAKGDSLKPLDHPYFDLLREQRRQHEDAIRRYDAEHTERNAA